VRATDSADTTASNDDSKGRAAITSQTTEKSVLSFESMRRGPAVSIVTLAIFINGIACILQVLLVRFPHQPLLFGELLPFGLFHWGRMISLTLGFMLIYLSFHILQRRTVAWWIAVLISAIAVITHFIQSRHWYTAVTPSATLVLLIVYRPWFSARTEPHSIRQGLILLGLCMVVAVSYGTIGFYLLEKRDFGISFSLYGSLIRTLNEFILSGSSDLHPVTRHARWFLESLRILGIVAVGFAAYSLFRPVVYKYVSLPNEREKAKEIIARWGRSSYDFFKTWPDKNFFFSGTGKSFVSYRETNGVAVCLGDPVGPENETAQIIDSFLHFCFDNGWSAAFMLPDLIPQYKKLGLSLLKIAEGAVIDLNHFCESTAKKKYFRYIKRKMENEGHSLTRYKPPHDHSLINEVEEISREWLALPKHREFGFIEGAFSREYLAETPFSVLRNQSGHAIAFVNEIPSHRPGEATIDMMRHRPDVHWGAMDYIFLELMHVLRQEGYGTFYLGLAGVTEKPGPTLMEKALFQITNHFNWLVNVKGVRMYKEKFEPNWEDRYLVYYGPPLSLPKISLAVIRIL
jgi:phosphatidylglycerol lysyltransferase